MTDAVGLRKRGAVIDAPRAVALGRFYFVMYGKGACSESEPEIEALAPAEWADDFGYGDLQDALTFALQDIDVDYLDGVETALLLHHPDLGDEIENALASRPVSHTDGLPLLDGRYRGAGIPFSVFSLPLPEMEPGGFVFMLHNPSKRCIRSLGDCLIEARFSIERFVFYALASFFRGYRKCVCDIDGSGAFTLFRVTMPSDEVWSLDVIDLVSVRATDVSDGESEDAMIGAMLAALIEKLADMAVANDGAKRLLAIYAPGREGDMPEDFVGDERLLNLFDAAAVVWSSKAVAFIKGGASSAQV